MSNNFNIFTALFNQFINQMKKIKTFVFFTVVVFGFSMFQKTSAQTTFADNKNLTDEQILKGFDEKACIEQMKKEGVRESEFLGCLRGRRITYLMNQRGIKGTISFPQKSMMSGPCVNSGFEDTSFTNWTAATGNLSNYPGPTAWTNGFSTTTTNALENDPLARQTIMTNTTGFDINAVNSGTGIAEIPYTAPGGGGVSVRLGNSYVTGVATTAETEKLDYPIVVTASNTSFTYKYAVVLENPTAHSSTQQPRFSIQVYDQFGVAISGPCGTYSIHADTAQFDTTYHPFNIAGIFDGYYKKWTTVTIDLTSYISSTVTIEFVTQDCTLGGHFGYAYIDCSCSQLQATTAFCPNDTVLMLVAPPGFVSYQWRDSNGILIPGPTGTNDTLWIPNPTLGQIYTVSMFSVSGCPTSLSVTLSTSTMQVNHGTLNGTCTGLNNGLAYVTTTGANAPFTYVWHDITTGGNVVGTNNDSIINMPSGTYYVTITTGGGCNGTDTMTINTPVFPTDTTLHNHVFVCPNDSAVTLVAPAGHSSYTWVDQSGTPIAGGNTATLILHAPFSPGQVYYCSLDCPHWFGDSLIQNSIQAAFTHTNVSCYGLNDGNASANNVTGAPGPYFYTWTNSAGTVVNSTATLSNAPAGTYIVNVHTYGGCGKTDTVIITQPFNPNDSVHLTTIFCMEDKNIVMRVQPGLGNYTWYAGDTSLTGIILSTYDTLLIPDPIVGSVYTILIHPPVGCDYLITSTLKYSPPPNLPNYLITSNVFTPDGDGVNDKFDVSLDPATRRSSTTGNITSTTTNEFAYVKDFHIEIFNRWGKKVFESSDVHTQWDGRINGNPADEGVYYWMASFTSLCTPGGEPHESTGFVQVVRKQ